MMKPAVAVIVLLLGPLSALADDVLRIDFEQGADVAGYARLDCGKTIAAIVAEGPDGRGHCLELRTTSPAASCGFTLKGPITLQRNLVLAFDYRTEIEAGYEGSYLGLSFEVDKKQRYWTSAPFSPTWRHAEIPLAALRNSTPGQEPHVGLAFSGVRIYAKVKQTGDASQQTKARLRVALDNVRLYTGTVAGRLSDTVRESWSDPPMLNWPRPKGAGQYVLQISREQTFPASAARTIELRRNFFMPNEPLGSGRWFWRVRTPTELSDAWSDVGQLEILPEAHRFATAATPVDDLARRAHPRLLALARVDQPEVTPQRKAELVKLAEKIWRRGVPEHPGPHVPGDPRWPTWIDWYGKVAGSITGGTGRRLQSIGQYAMLSGDAQVIGWARDLALEACKWDPDGGSAMKRGDIGAHHLLRGLSWCYDAAYDAMSPGQRETMSSIIVRRAEQFHTSLNPFRHGEANNHAWLQALGLAEAGIVLAGDQAGAADWAEFVRQLYVGKFLCCLGHQGENNEGIGYWAYGLGFVIDYGDLMKQVCAIDLFRHPWLSQTARFPMYCAPPNAWAVSFADTGMPNHGVRGPAETRQVRDLALRTADPYALWYSGAREPVDGLAPKAPVDLPASVHYRDIGVAIFNTSLVDGREGVTVAVHSGRYWAGHQHPDQNHFVIHAYGDKLAIDGGYYDWYGSPHFKAYSMHTLAHNTLLVDGEGQAVCKEGADGRIVRFHDSPGYGYVAGDASNPLIYHGKLKRFERRILFAKPQWVVVHDQVESHPDKPVRLDWLLHAVVPIKVDQAARTFTIQGPEATLTGRFLGAEPLEMEVKTGFPVEPVNRYSTNPVPKDKYFPEWTLYARPKGPVKRTEFLVAMHVSRKADQASPKIEPVAVTDGYGLLLADGDRRQRLVLRGIGSQGPSSGGGLETDGQAAAVETSSDGRVLRGLMINATTVRWQGRELSKASKPSDREIGPPKATD